MSSNGEFVVTYNREFQGESVVAQAFNAAAIPQGPEFLATSDPQIQVAVPQVAMGPSGNFVISWTDRDLDGDGFGVSARRFRPGVPQVQSTRINDGAAQRSRVTSLTVTFDTIVNFESTVADAFTLIRNGGKAVSFKATASNANGVTVVTLNDFTGSSTQFGLLADGRYTLTALSSHITDNQGQALDGDGNGQAGGNYTFGDAQGLFRFFGDINGDRNVDIADFGLFSSTYGLNSGQTGFISAFDFNNDGVIDIADFGQFSVRIFTILP
jgi:hypothetical protein